MHTEVQAHRQLREFRNHRGQFGAGAQVRCGNDRPAS